jgi:small subunit ribosomal protein S1
MQLRRARRAAGPSFSRGYTGRLPMAPDTVDRTEPQLEEGVWTTTPEGDLVPDYDATFPTINEGEVVHGTVVRVDKDEVLVDIGYKSEGVIPVSELSIRRSVNPADEVGLGDEIDALVLTKEDAEGRLILSKKRARFELAWKTIETKAETGEPIVGKVIEVVKGGLILDLGVRGFLPASLVDIRRVHDLDEFLGKELRAKVIELNRSRNNVVLSRRAVLEDERKEMRQAILDRLNPGDVVDGQISNIVDFGAFVDLDGMDGLIHISELSWRHVNHPSEVLEIGQEVKVKVLDIDRERQRISLGLKQTQSDPWQQVVEAYGEGDVVEGRVTKVVTFGAFVEILPGVEGLVHISELAQHHVENPREVVSQGDVVNVKVIEIDADRRRLSLSLKRVEEGEPVQPRADGAPLAANLDLSEDVFGNEPAAPVAEDVEVLDESLAEGSLEPVADVDPEPVAEVEPEPVAEVEPEQVAEVEPEQVAEVEPEPVAEVEPEPVAETEPEPAAEPPAADEEAEADQPA